MPFFESFDKTLINYESTAGIYPHTLIILHGWAVGRIENYESFRQHLDCFHLIFWDACNHGRSGSRARAKIGDLANDLRHFLTEIYRGKYPVTVIGHSMGALTLFEYVGRFGTDMISKMVIIDQTPKLLTNREWRLGMFGDCPAARNKEFIKAFNADIVKGIIYLTGFFLHKEIPARSSDQARFTVSNMPALTPEAASGLVSLWKSFTAKDFRPLVKKIAIPTLLLYGARSQFYKIETGEWMRDNIAGSRLKIFPAGDHNPFLGQPEEFFQGIKEFVLE